VSIPEPAACVKNAMISKYRKAFAMILIAFLPVVIFAARILIGHIGVTMIG
jgi:hypothetical protein